MQKPIEDFWAVTLSGSIYHVRAQKDTYGWPIVQKHFDRSGSTAGHFLENGHYVGIGKNMLVLFTPERPNDTAYDTSIKNIGGHTGPIVALCGTQEQALHIWDNKVIAWDWRFLSVSMGVLECIGLDHSVFRISPPLWHMVESVREFVEHQIDVSDELVRMTVEMP